MASTFSTNLNLELQGTGDNSGTWGGVLNANALDIVDQAMGDVQTFSLSNVNVTVSTAQSQKNCYKLTGTLTGNVTITWPAGIGRTYFIINNTTGNFTVTLASGGGGTTTTIQQGANGFIVLDGTNCIGQTDTGVPVSAVMAFAGSTVPNNWLECAGQAISRSTYSVLYAIIGTTYGPGDGTTTFNLPDLRGYFVRGWNHGAGSNPDTGRAIGSVQSDDNKSHTHVFTGNALPPHSHSYTIGSADVNGGIAADGANANGSPGTSSNSAGTPSGTNSNSGGTEARPFNVAMMYCIRVL